MSEIVKSYEARVDQLLEFAEKLQQEKSYLINLLIQSKEPGVSEVINKYLKWLNK